MAKVSASWRKLASSHTIQRSSQVVGVIGSNLALYSGEIKPRQPVDNKVYLIPLRNGPSNGKIQELEAPPADAAPTPRVGSASITIRDTMYLFSGRGGPSMKPLDEAGSLWSLSLSDSQGQESTAVKPQWNLIQPTTSLSASPPASRDGEGGGFSNTTWPDPRSYHAMTTDNEDTIYMSCGCPAEGRTSDLWAFQLSQRRWIRLSNAPDPPRGGTSIVYAKKDGDGSGKLYRMSGFDGKTEQGGAIDVYDLETDTWSSIKFKPDGTHGPMPRSVSSLVAVNVDGRQRLLAFGGERDPSSLGHEGAGKMLGDVWLWDLQSKTWNQLAIEGERPCPRGWFASDVVKSPNGNDAFVVHGGLDERNQRLGDVWVLQF